MEERANNATWLCAVGGERSRCLADSQARACLLLPCFLYRVLATCSHLHKKVLLPLAFSSLRSSRIIFICHPSAAFVTSPSTRGSSPSATMSSIPFNELTQDDLPDVRHIVAKFYGVDANALTNYRNLSWKQGSTSNIPKIPKGISIDFMNSEIQDRAVLVSIIFCPIGSEGHVLIFSPSSSSPSLTFPSSLGRASTAMVTLCILSCLSSHTSRNLRTVRNTTPFYSDSLRHPMKPPLSSSIML